MTTLLWFQRDLRLHDHPGLHWALRRGGPIVPVFVLPPDDEEGGWPLGAAARWYLHHSLVALDADLRALGSRLIVRAGPTEATLAALMRATDADSLVLHGRPEAFAARRERAIARALPGVVRLDDADLARVGDVRTRDGRLFRVFTPFWRALLELGSPPEPLPAPMELPRWPAPLDAALDDIPIDSFGLLPRIRWDAGLAERFSPGESNARRQLMTFAQQAAGAYEEARDLPGTAGTSSLSPSLAFGEVSPRSAWWAAQHAPAWQRQLAWRLFGRTLLTTAPDLANAPVDPRFASFPWLPDEAAAEAWRRGRTGVPIVDAAMRELWTTGWMHNRARMIVGSYLVKHLLQPWQVGERWFWDTLVDADLGNNAMGWQWVAGCGADAAPYFRVFAPTRQSERFDPQGVYLRRWLPELARLPDRWIHDPAAAPPLELAAAGVRIGGNWPVQRIGLQQGRERALAAFSTLSRSAASHVR